MGIKTIFRFASFTRGKAVTAAHRAVCERCGRMRWTVAGDKVTFLRKLAILALVLAWPPLVSGQFIGYVTSQSVSQNLFTNHTGSAISATITNLGQSSHYFTICNNLFNGTIIIQSSRDGTFNPPSTVTAANYNVQDSNCHIIQAGGYYATMRVQIISTTGQTSIFYSGIGGPVAPAPAAISTGGPSSPVACDQSVGPSDVPASDLGVTLVTGLVGQSVIVCSITLSFDGSTSGSTGGFITFGSLSSTSQPSGGSCTIGTNFGNPEYGIQVNAQTQQTLHFVGGPGGLVRFTAGNPFCVSTGSNGTAVTINVSYAQITF